VRTSKGEKEKKKIVTHERKHSLSEAKRQDDFSLLNKPPWATSFSKYFYLTAKMHLTLLAPPILTHRSKQIIVDYFQVLKLSVSLALP
jgi:hypothetical protein